MQNDKDKKPSKRDSAVQSMHSHLNNLNSFIRKSLDEDNSAYDRCLEEVKKWRGFVKQAVDALLDGETTTFMTFAVLDRNIRDLVMRASETNSYRMVYVTDGGNVFRAMLWAKSQLDASIKFRKFRTECSVSSVVRIEEKSNARQRRL